MTEKTRVPIWVFVLIITPVVSALLCCLILLFRPAPKPAPIEFDPKVFDENMKQFDRLVDEEIRKQKQDSTEDK